MSIIRQILQNKKGIETCPELLRIGMDITMDFLTFPITKD